MGKIHFIFEEFFRSFQRSLIKNILLMIMFSICILMVVIMASYYLDLGEREEYLATNYDKNGTWYNIRIPSSDMLEFERCFHTTAGSRDVMNYYEEICNIENHPVMSVNTSQNVLLIKDECNKIFGDKDYRIFQPIDAGTGVGADIGGVSAIYMVFKSAQFDVSAYDYFGLKTVAGEGLTRSNTVLKDESDEIPIVLGNNYNGIVSVGQNIHIAIDGSDYLFNCKVVGILESGTKIHDFGDSDQEDLIFLDSYIIFPYGIHADFDTDDNKKIAGYSYLNYRALWNSQMLFSFNTEFREVLEVFGRIGRKYKLSPLMIEGESMGQNLLRKEDAGNVRIMLIITICLVCFTFYSLFMTIYNKIKDNQKTYGIYLLNGSGIYMILVPFILEIAIILTPSLLVSKSLLKEEVLGIYSNFDAVINAAYLLILLAFLTGVLVLVFLIKGVNTEQLIKNGN